MSADAKRVDDLYQQRSTAWRTASHVQSNVERWLREAGPLADHETPLPTPVKGENNLLDQIENRRRRVRELRADLHRVRSSCYPSAYCKQRLRAQIEELAERGAPSVSALIEHDGEVIWPTTMLKARVHATEKGAVAIGEMIDVPALLAWIMVKDAGLLKRLDGLIESECDDKAALSHEAREKAEAELLGDLLAVERDEATLMFKGWAEGLACGAARRP